LARQQVTGNTVLVALTVSSIVAVATSVFLIDCQDARHSTTEVHPPCSQLDHLLSLIQHHCFHFLPSLEGELEGPMMVGEVLSTEMGQDETQLLLVRSMC